MTAWGLGVVVLVCLSLGLGQSTLEQRVFTPNLELSLVYETAEFYPLYW